MIPLSSVCFDSIGSPFLAISYLLYFGEDDVLFCKLLICIS